MWYPSSNPLDLRFAEPLPSSNLPSDYCRPLDDSPTNLWNLPDLAVDFAPPAIPARHAVRPLFTARDHVTHPLKRRRHALDQ